MRRHRPLFDPSSVRTDGKTTIIFELLELRVQVEAPLPPLVEGDVAMAHCAEPVGGLALDGQVEVPRREQLDALEAEASAVHRVLRVVAVGGNKLFSLSTASSSMAAAASTEEPHRLRLHVAAVSGHDVPADERLAETSQLIAFGRGVDDGGPKGT